ncbi:trypsin-like peptidase domain-containing protein [Iamia majanohamensis]|uniref:Trypsin-like peptidase domain-containing protein n=1 Tax=Iamia majanohamensis TaxID=467976 RepID=A0AAE9Y434_9ACTN|nr:trypsin-like peptidase domain-containing protein [Iamia majanohamensis]WCO65809.1 trypsin-like peptidase domain-containing protein [Iamia majanohamensis]
MSVLAEIAAATRAAHAVAAPATVAIGRHARGAGVVIAPDRVLTSAHNLRDRTTQVTFADGTHAQASLVGSDADHDVVVLEVPTGDATPLTWADTPPQPGDAVFALARTAGGDRITAGSVSGVGRSFRGPRGRRVTGAVEHTAPLARGSSGGPLVDADGRLVGLNTHRLGDGFYLALPADDDLRARVDALVGGRHLRTRRLGIVIVPGPRAARLRARVGLPEAAGLLVRAVAEGSPAAAAGLDEGDLVTAVDGQPVASVDDLWDALDAAADRTSVEVTALRGADERTVTVTFADDPDDAAG